MSDVVEATSQELKATLDTWRGATGPSKQDLGDKAAAIAVERSSVLARAMELNPEGTFDLLLSVSDRVDLETLAPGTSTKVADLTGTLEVDVGLFENGDPDDFSTVHVTAYYLRTSGGIVRLLPVRGEGRLDLAGKEVGVHGDRFGDNVLYDASAPDGLVDLTPPEPEGDSGGKGGKGGGKGGKGGSEGPVVVGREDANGMKHWLVIPLLFAGQEIPGPVSELVTVMSEVHNFNQVQSYGKLGYTYDVLPDWLYSNLEQDGSTSTALREAVRLADPTVDFTLYDGMAIVTDARGFYGGWGTICSGRSVNTDEGTVHLGISWDNWYYYRNDLESRVFLLAHEMGHNQCFHHASFKNTQDRHWNDNDYTNVEYGDRSSTMGTGWETTDYAGSHKYDIGAWYEPENVVLVEEDGRYDIAPTELSTTEPQLLLIPRRSDYIYLSYRQQLGNDHDLDTQFMCGPQLHLKNSWRSLMVDPTTGPNNWASAYSSCLAPGESTVDTDTGTQIATVNAGPNGVTVDIVVGLCTDYDRPSAYITSPSWNEVVTETITIAATATDQSSPIDRVEFYYREYTSSGVVDQLIASDTTEPYEVLFDTTQVSNGYQNFFVRAYDDPGPDCEPNVSYDNYVRVFVANGDDGTPPTVTLTAPTQNEKYTRYERFTMAADAQDTGGIWHVEFYVDINGYSPCERANDHALAGGHPPMCRFRPFFEPFSRYQGCCGWNRQAFYMGAATLPPYQINVRNLPPGRYKMYAVATDHTFNRAVSEPVDVTIQGERPYRIIILAPQHNQEVQPGSIMTIQTDPDEHLLETWTVDFYVDDTLIGTIDRPPYEIDWQVPETPGEAYTIEIDATSIAGLTDKDSIRVTTP